MTHSNDNDPRNLLRNPRKVVPPSEHYGLDRWRRLPVEGHGPVHSFTWGDWVMVAVGTAILTYFLLRGLF